MSENAMGNADEMMERLRRRVAEKKAQGLYSVDVLAVDTMNPIEPLHVDDLIALQSLANVTPDFTIHPSTKPVLGRAITQGKKAVSRVTRQPVQDIALRTGEFNEALVHYVTRLSQDLAAVRAELASLQGRLDDDKAGGETR